MRTENSNDYTLIAATSSELVLHKEILKALASYTHFNSLVCREALSDKYNFTDQKMHTSIKLTD